MNITSWHIILACGAHKHGTDIGSFKNVKQNEKLYDSVLDLYVETPAGKIFAYREKGTKPKFDFHIHVINELCLGSGKSMTAKCWKLTSMYPNKTIIRYVSGDGKKTKNVII